MAPTGQHCLHSSGMCYCGQGTKYVYVCCFPTTEDMFPVHSLFMDRADTKSLKDIRRRVLALVVVVVAVGVVWITVMTSVYQ